MVLYCSPARVVHHKRNTLVSCYFNGGDEEVSNKNKKVRQRVPAFCVLLLIIIHRCWTKIRAALRFFIKILNTISKCISTGV